MLLRLGQGKRPKTLGHRENSESPGFRGLPQASMTASDVPGLTVMILVPTDSEQTPKLPQQTKLCDSSPDDPGVHGLSLSLSHQAPGSALPRLVIEDFSRPITPPGMLSGARNFHPN